MVQPASAEHGTLRESAQDDVTAVDPGPLPALDEPPAPVDVQRFLGDLRHPRAEVFTVAGDGLR